MPKYPKLEYPNYEGRKILYNQYDNEWNDHMLTEKRVSKQVRPQRTQKIHSKVANLASKRAIEDTSRDIVPNEDNLYDILWNDHFHTDESSVPRAHGSGNPELALRVDHKSLDIKSLRRHAKTLNVPIHHIVDGKKKLIAKKILLGELERVHGSGWYDLVQKGINTVKDVGKQAYNKVYDTVDTFLNSRDSNPAIRKFLSEHGDKNITHITISREPLPRAITSLLHIITSGKSLKSIGRLGYDDLYHLALKLDLSDGSSYRFEKNETINVLPWKSKSNADYKDVMVIKPVTVNEFYTNAYDYSKKHNIPFYKYNVVSANCQMFLNVCLSGNSGYVNYSQDDKDFIMQDVGAILESAPYLESVVSKVTGLKDAINVAIYGKGRPVKKVAKKINRLANKIY